MDSFPSQIIFLFPNYSHRPNDQKSERLQHMLVWSLQETFVIIIVNAENRCAAQYYSGNTLQ